MTQVNKKTVYKADKNAVIHFAKVLESQGVLEQGMEAAVRFLQDTLYAQKGNEKRKLAADEAAKLIKR